MSKRQRHTADEIIRKLREAERLQSEGRSVSEIARSLGVSKQTFARCRNQYGGMKGPDMKRLKELERENAELKRIVAEQALDNRMLKDIAKGNF